jgi:hypothetical protein
VTTCAAFIKESRMKLVSPSGLDRKSGGMGHPLSRGRTNSSTGVFSHLLEQTWGTLWDAFEPWQDEVLRWVGYYPPNLAAPRARNGQSRVMQAAKKPSPGYDPGSVRRK